MTGDEDDLVVTSTCREGSEWSGVGEIGVRDDHPLEPLPGEVVAPRRGRVVEPRSGIVEHLGSEVTRPRSDFGSRRHDDDR